MNGWQITTVTAAGINSSTATVITRDSPWMVVNLIVDGNSNNIGAQLPVSGVETGDLVEVCVGSTSNSVGNVWYGATVIDSSTTLVTQIDRGRMHSFRFLSGSQWTREEDA